MHAHALPPPASPSTSARASGPHEEGTPNGYALWFRLLATASAIVRGEGSLRASAAKLAEAAGWVCACPRWQPYVALIVVEPC